MSAQGTATTSTTRAVRAAIGSDTAHRAVVPPLYLSANFVFESPGVCGRYDYTRSGNPTRDHLAEALADLEGGCGAIITASGMAAISVVTQLLGCGDTLLAPHDGYGGSYRLFTAEGRRVGYETVFVDQTSEQALDIARARRPRVIWIETPSNPFLRITDIRRWTDLARDIGAVSVVDNTFLSPANQLPLELGADLVVHSATKFINGHSDVVAGAIIAKDPALLDQLAWWTNCLGVAGAPFDAYLALRGLRTLFARSAVHERNALRVVDVLATHDTVTGLYHPSLATHGGHDIAARQQSGWGSLVSLELAGGRPAVDAFLRELRLFTLAESLGGVESLVSHPTTMTHASMDEEGRRVAGIHDGLLRLSVGIEDADDLVADLQNALTKAEEVACTPV
jgi:cystathionine gamma-synthase